MDDRKAPLSNAPKTGSSRNCLSLLDLGPDGVRQVLERAQAFKRLRGTGEHPQPLRGKSVAILLEKASTRTRLSFEVAIYELGGQPLTQIARDTQLGRGETVEDTARMLSRYVHGVVYRTSGHDRLQRLGDHLDVPLINGLSDLYHPCQALADLLTLQQHKRAALEGLRVAWIGDGSNVANSWILAAGMVGLDLRLACPAGHDPSEEAVTAARGLGRGDIRLTREPEEALRDVDVVVTDVWSSMGQESEADARRAVLGNYHVDAARMQLAAADAIFLHCLPAHRGEEVSAEVIDGPQSRVWDEAENRLHSQKALLEHLLATSA